jgi:hypothetical protein
VNFAPFQLRHVGTLLRSEPRVVLGWTEQWQARALLTHSLIIVMGAGCYGAAVGWWRGPEQALYTAIKFPLLMFLTTCGTGLLNGMMAPLLGLNIPFRQSFLTILMPHDPDELFHSGCNSRSVRAVGGVHDLERPAYRRCAEAGRRL